MEALAQRQAPEPGIVHITPPLTKAGTPLAWHNRTTNDSGFLDLTPICDEPTDAIAYATCTLFSPDEREVRFAIGTDDGSRLWVNGDLVFDDPEYHSATRDAKTFTATLTPGDNIILCKILNGTNDFGLYLRVMDDQVKPSAQ
ncbi:MAG: hypothetical protein HOJ54_03630 [Phycisphaerae bacterium]|nr:hypothetical protein [Phycisphaerae bacterium]